MSKERFADEQPSSGEISEPDRRYVSHACHIT